MHDTLSSLSLILFYFIFFFCCRTASKVVALAPAPESETTTELTPASPPVETEVPARSTPGMARPMLNPSESASSYVYPAPLLLLLVGVAIFKSY